ncbi:MAG TPA: fatty acid desaturase [Tepidisphaeraceae bacterium]|jgi:beta-carotene hydroxylase|nr:fatty acid desaturase [Tepidisphaeraceae bacterium]
MSEAPPATQLPTIGELGADLLTITRERRALTLATPFICVAAYFVLASVRLWPLAVLSLMYLSFVTYGSISHDLVHRTLALPRRWNEFFLTTIELLAFRSGHAYRLAHLHHHARFPHDDDIEGTAAKMSFWRTLLEGVIFQPRIMWWALAHKHQLRHVVAMEVVAALGLLLICLVTLAWTPLFGVYAVLMVMGAWVIPLVTSYLPHNPEGATALLQTKLFRGKVASIIAMEHLYHLEHHLYPMVPHHNWPELARRLDPVFKSAGIRPIVLGF